jgi:hypothetical protein
MAAAIMTDAGKDRSIMSQLLTGLSNQYLNIGSFAVPASTASIRLQLMLSDDKELANEVNSVRKDILK